LVDHAEGWFFALMSAFLFSGLENTMRIPEKNIMGIA